MNYVAVDIFKIQKSTTDIRSPVIVGNSETDCVVKPIGIFLYYVFEMAQ